MRRYKDEPIPEEILTPLRDRIREINEKTGLHIQLVTGEPRAFSGPTPRKPCSRTPRRSRPFREQRVDEGYGRILGRNDNASVAGLVDVGSYSACIVDKENQRIPYGRVKISREVQVIRQDLSGEGTDEFLLRQTYWNTPSQSHLLPLFTRRWKAICS